MDTIKPPDYLVQKTDANSAEGLWKKTIEKLVICINIVIIFFKFLLNFLLTTNYLISTYIAIFGVSALPSHK